MLSGFYIVLIIFIFKYYIKFPMRYISIQWWCNPIISQYPNIYLFNLFLLYSIYLTLSFLNVYYFHFYLSFSNIFIIYMWYISHSYIIHILFIHYILYRIIWFNIQWCFLFLLFLLLFPLHILLNVILSVMLILSNYNHLLFDHMVILLIFYSRIYTLTLSNIFYIYYCVVVVVVFDVVVFLMYLY